ncbi:MAG: BspA family leucine-rich repeat surface protein [Prevotella copri]|nr:BspA family leucine-rich repeat surface protein [Segatella copri]
MMKRFTNQSNGSHVGRMYNGGAIIRRFALFPLMLLMLLFLPARMVAQTSATSSKYIATYESSTQTLTFKKNVGESLPKNSAWVINKKSVAFINEKLGNVTIVHIVFDKSFSTYTPTSLFRFFMNLTKLETITGLEYLNTAKVTDMSYMFSGCSSLTSLDVTHFNTANVTNMSSMFSSCPSLTSLDVTHFNTAKVTDMSYMFCRCLSLTSLDVTYFNTTNVTDMSYMFSRCVALTSLYLTNFNTEKVTDMNNMFSYSRALTTIYASSKFVTTQVSNSSGMFNNCEKLKGEEEWKNDKATDKTYAKIEGGYFSGAIPRVKYADGTLTFFLASKETLGENEYELNRGAKTPGWANHSKEITKVVFDTSFANAKPTSCCRWFFGCDKLKQIEGIKNLNTENVKDMSNMFYGCSGLISLDVTNFNTANVTNMLAMFSSCNNLATIYTSEKFVTTKVENLNSLMFKGDENLKGALPVYKATKISCKYANYKTGYFTKLVGKNGDEKIGATGETLTTDNLVLDDDKDFVAYEPFAAKAASYSRTINAGTTWATLCLPFEVSLDGKNFRAFKLLSADDVTETVELEEIEGSIAAGTPVIIKMNDGATKLDFTVANKEIAKDVQTAETANGNYQLQGLYTQKVFSKDTDNNCYIVKGDKLMNPAKLLDKTTTEFVGSKPFRAYMVDNSSAPAAGARMFSISVGGSTTAIEQLETTADSKAEYYDLQGRRLQNLQKGVNIVKRGGKTMKVIIK